MLSSILTPGHSAGSTSYLLEASAYRALFSGDAVFLGGFISVLNVEGSDPGAYRRCLPALANLQVDGLYPGHCLFSPHETPQAPFRGDPGSRCGKVGSTSTCCSSVCGAACCRTSP